MTPLCHLTLRPVDSGSVDEHQHVIWETRGTPCVGSLCSAWKAWAKTDLGSCGLVRDEDPTLWGDPAPTPTEPK